MRESSCPMTETWRWNYIVLINKAIFKLPSLNNKS